MHGLPQTRAGWLLGHCLKELWWKCDRIGNSQRKSSAFHRTTPPQAVAGHASAHLPRSMGCQMYIYIHMCIYIHIYIYIHVHIRDIHMYMCVSHMHAQHIYGRSALIICMSGVPHSCNVHMQAHTNMVFLLGCLPPAHRSEKWTVMHRGDPVRMQ